MDMSLPKLQQSVKIDESNAVVLAIGYNVEDVQLVTVTAAASIAMQRI